MPTILDISGYSTISERLPPDLVSDLVEKYFSSFLDCVVQAGGDMTETSGDGFMAIFQDEDPAQHAACAVDAALAAGNRPFLNGTRIRTLDGGSVLLEN